MRKLLAFGAGILFACVVILLAPSAFAATDITGDWTAKRVTPNGEFQITFTFKQDGAKLTGSVTGPMGQPVEFSNGKVDGDKVYFESTANESKLINQGVVNGDEIKLKITSDDPRFPGLELTLKRAK